MSHHYSDPDLAFPGGDAGWDLADLYPYPKPDHAGKSIFVTKVPLVRETTARRIK